MGGRLELCCWRALHASHAMLSLLSSWGMSVLNAQYARLRSQGLSICEDTVMFKACDARACWFLPCGLRYGMLPASPTKAQSLCEDTVRLPQTTQSL